MKTYTAYGLNIHTALGFPELSHAEVHPSSEDGNADVCVHYGKVENVPIESDGEPRYIRFTPDGIFLTWRGIGTYLVRGGNEIIIDPVPEVDEPVLRLITLGTALAMLLHQRGELVIVHASAVGISGHAAAFVGVKYSGKSTIAATLHKLGHNLLADDILAVDLDQGGPTALPGFPHCKLWPDSVASLGHAPETLPQLHPQLEKRGYQIVNGFSSAPVPLRCIYVLSHGEEPAIEPLRPQEAWLELLPHWYGARFGRDVLQSLGISTHFLQCAELAKQVSVCRLKRPRSLSAILDVARLVEAHF